MRNNTVVIENARICCRNFSGEKDAYNTNGERRFLCILDREMALSLKEEGWNIKQFKPSENGEEGDYFVQVAVSYKVAPPSVFIVSGKKKIRLDEETVGQLDWAEIDTVDLILTPHNWEMNSRRGVKVYLKTLYATVIQDKLDEKYADLDENCDEEAPF